MWIVWLFPAAMLILLIWALWPKIGWIVIHCLERISSRSRAGRRNRHVAR